MSTEGRTHMFGSFGMLEILIILVVGVVVFGVIKLPRFAKSIGSGLQELKRLKRGFEMGLGEEEEQFEKTDSGQVQPNQQYRQAPGPQGYAQQDDSQPHKTGDGMPG